MSAASVPPQNLEAEESVLGAMMLAPGAIGAVSEVLSASDFYRESHGTIYRAALDLYSHGEPVDAITLPAELEKRGELEEVGGRSRIHELAALVPATANVGHYARIVRDAARCRREDLLGLRIREASRNGGVPAHPELLAELRNMLAGLDRDGADEHATRIIDGLSFVSAPEGASTEANWGAGDAVLWACGEPLLICGPDGIGKSTLAQRLALARLDGGTLLGLPVARAVGRVLYVAADRPPQAARSMRRMMGDVDEGLLRERLVVHRGPLPFDVVTAPPWTLRQFAEGLGASDVVVDSLKDLAGELTRDEVGGAVNRAFQEACAGGLELAVLHHQRKQQQGAPAPQKLADVYGSRWLVAGMGSVVMLWGQPGDLVVAFRHLKQPVAEVGPFDLLHDHVHGRTNVHEHADLEQLLGRAPGGLTVRDAARLIFAKDNPGRNEVEKARRRLEDLIARYRADRRDDPDGVARYFAKEAP